MKNNLLSFYDLLIAILPQAIESSNLHKPFCISLAVVLVNSVLSAVAESKHLVSSRKQEEKHSHLTEMATKKDQLLVKNGSK